MAKLVEGFEESVVVPTIQHSLSDVIGALNNKIAQLELSKDMVQEQIKNGNRVEENSACVSQINESLQAALQAKSALEDSCCTTQSCNFAYYD
jgi:hypothetical protein